MEYFLRLILSLLRENHSFLKELAFRSAMPDSPRPPRFLLISFIRFSVERIYNENEYAENEYQKVIPNCKDASRPAPHLQGRAGGWCIAQRSLVSSKAQENKPEIQNREHDWHQKPQRRAEGPLRRVRASRLFGFIRHRRCLRHLEIPLRPTLA